MLSISDCLTKCLSWGDSLAQCPVIFLRRSTAASWRTLGVLAVRRCCTSAGTTCGSFAKRFICSSACRRASLSGIKNCINKSSKDWAISSFFVSLSLSLYLCVCVLCFCGYRERGCCACEGFWVLLCFVFKGGFFLGGFVVWRIGQVFKNRSCTWDHCCVLGPPSTRGLCTDYRQYIMLAPFLFIFNTTLFFFFGEK